MPWGQRPRWAGWCCEVPSDKGPFPHLGLSSRNLQPRRGSHQKGAGQGQVHTGNRGHGDGCPSCGPGAGRLGLLPGLRLHQPPRGGEDEAAAARGAAGPRHLPTALQGLFGLGSSRGPCRRAVWPAEGAGCRPPLPGPHEWRPLLLLQPGGPGWPHPAAWWHPGCGRRGWGTGSLRGEPRLLGQNTTAGPDGGRNGRGAPAPSPECSGCLGDHLAAAGPGGAMAGRGRGCAQSHGRLSRAAGHLCLCQGLGAGATVAPGRQLAGRFGWRHDQQRGRGCSHDPLRRGQHAALQSARGRNWQRPDVWWPCRLPGEDLAAGGPPGALQGAGPGLPAPGPPHHPQHALLG